MEAPQVRKHESGLRTQQVTGPNVRLRQTHYLQLPPMCPVSGNPQQGSTLVVRYRPEGWCLEVYSIDQLLQRFAGGWKGTQRYPAERNMEGAIALIVQMVADAVGVPVKFWAEIQLDTQTIMRLEGKAAPWP